MIEDDKRKEITFLFNNLLNVQVSSFGLILFVFVYSLGNCSSDAVFYHKVYMK